MRPSQDWKTQLRQQIYISNYHAMSDHYQLHLQHTLRIASATEQASSMFTASTTAEPAEEKDLEDFSHHTQRSFYIPVKQNLEVINEIDSTLPFLQTMKPSARELVLRDLQCKIKDKLAQQQQFDWPSILKKFLCPLDTLNKISLYCELLKNGTQYIEAFRINLASQMSPFLFFHHIITAQRYIYPNRPYFLTLNSQTSKQKKEICKICCVYGCFKHKDIQPRPNFDARGNSKDNNDIIIQSYLCFYRQIKGIQKQADLSKPICSHRCFKRLNLATFEVLLQSYTENSIDQNRTIEIARQIYLFQPCKISKLTQISCRQVCMYLVVNYPLTKMVISLGMPEFDYLAQKYKQDTVPKQQGRRQRREDSLENYEPKNTLKCNNQPRDIDIPKFIRIGKRNNNQLSLFTMRQLKKGQLIFWLSGQRLTPPLSELRHLLSQQPGCKYEHNLISSLRMGSKYRFLLHSNSLVGNVGMARVEVNNEPLWFLYAKQKIKQYDELLYPCPCKSVAL